MTNNLMFILLYMIGCGMSYLAFMRLNTDRPAAAVTAAFWPVVWLMIILLVLDDRLGGEK